MIFLEFFQPTCLGFCGLGIVLSHFFWALCFSSDFLVLMLGLCLRTLGQFLVFLDDHLFQRDKSSDYIFIVCYFSLISLKKYVFLVIFFPCESFLECQVPMTSEGRVQFIGHKPSYYSGFIGW